MKLMRPGIVALTLLVAAGSVNAAHVWSDTGNWWDTHWSYTRNTPRFQANEFSFDIFGSYVNPERGFDEIFDTSIREGDWGGGVGLNYFPLRYLGVGADINMADNRGALVDHVIGNLVLRLPIESIGLAPYVFGGGGRGIDPEWEWLGDFGVGLEFRFNPVTGIFTDARYIWADKSQDRLLIRAGLRLAL